MTETRLTPNLDLDGLQPDEAFAVLGNEIRLDIVRVLWHADAAHEYDDGSDSAETMSYSKLRQQVGIDDNGKFNYHLSELAPHFIRQTDNGYRLSGAGKQIARTVIAISGTEPLDFSAELEEDCPLCEAPMTATYEDQWLRVRCTECDGLFGDQAPAGTLFLTNFPTAGLTDRSSDEVLAAGLYRCALDITYMMYGVCRECAGMISSSVSVCDTHDSQGNQPCATCGTPFRVWAEMWCDTCGFAKRLPVEMFVTGLVTVVGLFDDHETDDRLLSLDDAIDLLQNGVETDVLEDPFRVSITIEQEATTFTTVLDEDMNVVDLDREFRTDAPS